MAVAIGQLWRRDGVAHDRDLETHLQEVPEVRFDAEIGQHSGENDLVYPLLAELQHQIVCLWSVELVRRADDGLAIIDEGFELRHEFGARSGKAVQRQRAFAIEELQVMLQDLDRGCESPAMVL